MSRVYIYTHEEAPCFVLTMRAFQDEHVTPGGQLGRVLSEDVGTCLGSAHGSVHILCPAPISTLARATPGGRTFVLCPHAAAASC